MKNFFSKESLKRLFESTSPKRISFLQKGMVFLIGGFLFVVIIFVSNSSDQKRIEKRDHLEKTKVESVSFSGPASSAPREEVWATRVQQEAEKMKNENKALKEELSLVGKEVEILKKFLEKGLSPQSEKSSGDPEEAIKKKENLYEENPSYEGNPLPLNSLPMQPDSQPLPSHSSYSTPKGINPAHGQDVAEGFKNIAHIKRAGGVNKQNLVEGIIPTGSRVPGVLLTGLAVSTAVQTKDHPHPVLVRLRDDFILPRGFKAPLKNAMISGSCYGDLSSERAFCRLTTISYVEPNGEIVDQAVEGWIFGEDGRNGLKGQIVDKADEAIRNSFIAGLVSGMSNFLKSSTTSSVFPVSPFGQTNALKPSEMLQAGGANGVGEAMDRLSKYYIDMAEKMSPVVLINPGRKVDIILQKKLDISVTKYRQARVQNVRARRQAFGIEHAAQQSQNIDIRGDLK